jgi:hypothetical protein
MDDDLKMLREAVSQADSFSVELMIKRVMFKKELCIDTLQRLHQRLFDAYALCDKLAMNAGDENGNP